jgi:hypothetical protein
MRTAFNVGNKEMKNMAGTHETLQQLRSWEENGAGWN